MAELNTCNKDHMKDTEDPQRPAKPPVYAVWALQEARAPSL